MEGDAEEKQETEPEAITLEKKEHVDDKKEEEGQDDEDERRRRIFQWRRYWIKCSPLRQFRAKSHSLEGSGRENGLSSNRSNGTEDRGQALSRD